MPDPWIIIKETCPECGSRVIAKASLLAHVTVGTIVRCIGCSTEGIYSDYQDKRGMYICWNEPGNYDKK